MQLLWPSILSIWNMEHKSNFTQSQTSSLIKLFYVLRYWPRSAKARMFFLIFCTLLLCFFFSRKLFLFLLCFDKSLDCKFNVQINTEAHHLLIKITLFVQCGPEHNAYIISGSVWEEWRTVSQGEHYWFYSTTLYCTKAGFRNLESKIMH